MQQVIDGCDRCDVPQGEIVILNSKERVCGGCITQIASRADIAPYIGIDRTPASECGFIS